MNWIKFVYSLKKNIYSNDIGLGLWYLTPLPTKLTLYSGGEAYL